LLSDGESLSRGEADVDSIFNEVRFIYHVTQWLLGRFKRFYKLQSVRTYTKKTGSVYKIGFRDWAASFIEVLRTFRQLLQCHLQDEYHVQEQKAAVCGRLYSL